MASVLTPDQILSLAQRTLHCSSTISITTSGYTDRYLSYRTRYAMDLGGDPRCCLAWDSEEEALATLLALTGAEWEAIYSLVRDCPHVTWSHYQDGASSGTVRVRPEVLGAIAEWASEQVQPRFTAEAGEKRAAIAATATQDERHCARWQLAECNRLNQRLIDLGLRDGYQTQVPESLVDRIGGL